MDKSALWSKAGAAVTFLGLGAAVGLDAADLITPTVGAWMAGVSLFGILCVLLWVAHAELWPVVQKRPRLGRVALAILAFAAAAFGLWYFWDEWPALAKYANSHGLVWIVGGVLLSILAFTAILAAVRKRSPGTGEGMHAESVTAVETSPVGPITMGWGEDQWHGQHLAIMALVTGDAVETKGIVLTKLEVWSEAAARFVTGSGGEEAWIFVPRWIDPAEMAEPESNHRIFASVDGAEFVIKNHKHPPRYKIKKSQPGLWRATMTIKLPDEEYENQLCFRYEDRRLSPAADPTKS